MDVLFYLLLYNKIESEGLISLSNNLIFIKDCLYYISKVLFINVDNKIGEKGMINLSNNLKFIITKLLNLNLGCNDIGNNCINEIFYKIS